MMLDMNDAAHAARRTEEVEARYKTCSCCGRGFAHRSDFARLPLCGSGYQPQFDENGDQRTDVRLELRNCDCGSTICVEVPCLAPEQLLAEVARRRGIEAWRARAVREAVADAEVIQ